MGKIDLQLTSYLCYNTIVCPDVHVTSRLRQLPNVGFFSNRVRFAYIYTSDLNDFFSVFIEINILTCHHKYLEYHTVLRIHLTQLRFCVVLVCVRCSKSVRHLRLEQDGLIVVRKTIPKPGRKYSHFGGDYRRRQNG